MFVCYWHYLVLGQFITDFLQSQMNNLVTSYHRKIDNQPDSQMFCLLAFGYP